MLFLLKTLFFNPCSSSDSQVLQLIFFALTGICRSTYDMLPMFCMPIAGEVVAQELGVEKMVPTAHVLDVWGEAQALALAFWQAVERDERVSSGFRQLAEGNALALAMAMAPSLQVRPPASASTVA